MALDNKILRDVIEKTIEPEVKKEITTEIIQEHSVCIAQNMSANDDSPFTLFIGRHGTQ